MDLQYSLKAYPVESFCDCGTDVKKNKVFVTSRIHASRNFSCSVNHNRLSFDGKGLVDGSSTGSCENIFGEGSVG